MKDSRLKRVLMWYRFIPTMLTLGNVLCGFTAILNSLLVYKVAENEVPLLLTKSAWLIVFAMIFDLLDGWTARKLNATSELGLQMDSLADMVTFGVAPAIMVAVLAHKMPLRYAGESYYWVWMLCGIYVSCVALRLALYNVIATNEGSSDTFNGLPSPGGAAAVSSFIFVYNFFCKGGELRGVLRGVLNWLAHWGVVGPHIKPDAVAEYVLNILPIYAAILGFLMVSKIPYYHFGKWLGKRKKHRLRMFLVIVFFIAFSCHPLIVTTVTVNTYVLWAPIKYLLGFAHRARKTAPGVAEKANDAAVTGQ